MAATASDPTQWTDADLTTPPAQWEAIATDDHWYWDDSGGFVTNPGPVVYIGPDPLQDLVELDWEVINDASEPIELRIYDSDLVLIDSFPLTSGETGSGTITFNISDYPGQLSTTNFAFGVVGTSPGTYFGRTKVLGPFTPIPDPTRGRSITEIEFDAMNSSFGDWAPAYLVSTVYEHFAHDPRDPKSYYLYPKLANMQVFLKYAQLPTALTALANTITLGDEYRNAIVAYVTYRCLAKDGRYGTEPAARTELWNNFLRELGMKVAADDRVDPATNRAPGDKHG